MMRNRNQVFKAALVVVALIAIHSYCLSQTKPCAPAGSGLMSWWPGDSNDNGIAKDIAGKNDARFLNGATVAPGMVGQAFKFQGKGSVDTLSAKASLLNPGNRLTLEFWMKGDKGNLMNACCQGLVVSDYYGIELSPGRNARTGVNFWIDVGGPLRGGTPAYHTSDSAGGGFTIEPGKWYHVAGVYNGSAIVLYVNGSAVVQTPVTGKILPMKAKGPGHLTIGANAGRGTRHVRQFRGLIDEIKIYNRDLSASEVQAIFNAGSAGNCKMTAASGK